MLVAKMKKAAEAAGADVNIGAGASAFPITI